MSIDFLCPTAIINEYLKRRFSKIPFSRKKVEWRLFIRFLSRFMDLKVMINVISLTGAYCFYFPSLVYLCSKKESQLTSIQFFDAHSRH